VFGTYSQYHPRLALACKTSANTSEATYKTTLSLALTYETKVEVIDNIKHSSLLQCGIDYDRKKF